VSSFLLCRGDARALPFADNSIDAVVCDPPYELGFMGKRWDKSGVAFDPATWAEAHRVLKDGGRLLAFGGSRTAHRIWCAIEDGGFTIEDTIMWIYGSGFPKHKSKLKPAYEPICVARKGGVSELNIDAARINPGEWIQGGGNGRATVPNGFGGGLTKERGTRPIVEPHDAGRWPANVCLNEEAAAALDEQSGIQKSGVAVQRNGGGQKIGTHVYMGSQGGIVRPDHGLGDIGGASRFFYTAKASRSEREAGLEGLGKRSGGSNAKGFTEDVERGLDRNRPVANHHPTVKPVDLMRWLVRLISRAKATSCSTHSRAAARRAWRASKKVEGSPESNSTTTTSR
jgi:hypothetical protein